MSWWYRVLYKFGVTPWEVDASEGPAAEQIARLFDAEESGREPPFGKALDLGCGTGIWSVRLAQRGWKVTGVDVVPKAIRQARERARASGAEVRFLEGDVNALRAAGTGSGFWFVLDFECFNHLNDAQRNAVGREVSAVTTPDASMLMLVWEPGPRGPLPHGASRRDVEEAFEEWNVIDEEPYAATSTLPWWLKNAGIRFYRLRRRPNE
jgi:SAM-dependent methyltransferase